MVRLSRSSDVKGLDAWAAKNEVSRREVMAQLTCKSGAGPRSGSLT